jgi:hypothetical protein
MSDVALSDGKGPGRDDLGRFLPGHSLGGRPPGIDIRALARQSKDRTPEQRIETALEALSKQADGGNVQAIKLLTDLLCEKDGEKLTVNYSGLGPAELRARLRVMIEDAFATEG